MESERGVSISMQPVLPLTAQRCNVLSNIVITPGASTSRGCESVPQAAGSVKHSHPRTGPPSVHLGSQEFGEIPPEALDLLDDYERRAKVPKLEPTASASAEKNTAETKASVSNLVMQDGDIDNFLFNLTPVPALLSPLRDDDDDFTTAPGTKSSSSYSKGKAKAPPKKEQGRSRAKTPKKSKGQKPDSAILRKILDRPSAGLHKSATGSKQPAEERNNTDSELSCFSQSTDKDTVTTFLDFYNNVKREREGKIKAIQETEVELQRARELVTRLENELKQHRRDLDKAERKQRQIEEKVKKTFGF